MRRLESFVGSIRWDEISLPLSDNRWKSSQRTPCQSASPLHLRGERQAHRYRLESELRLVPRWTCASLHNQRGRTRPRLSRGLDGTQEGLEVRYRAPGQLALSRRRQLGHTASRGLGWRSPAFCVAGSRSRNPQAATGRCRLNYSVRRRTCANCSHGFVARLALIILHHY